MRNLNILATHIHVCRDKSATPSGGTWCFQLHGQTYAQCINDTSMHSCMESFCWRKYSIHIVLTKVFRACVVTGHVHVTPLLQLLHVASSFLPQPSFRISSCTRAGDWQCVSSSLHLVAPPPGWYTASPPSIHLPYCISHCSTERKQAEYSECLFSYILTLHILIAVMFVKSRALVHFVDTWLYVAMCVFVWALPIMKVK